MNESSSISVAGSGAPDRKRDRSLHPIKRARPATIGEWPLRGGEGGTILCFSSRVRDSRAIEHPAISLDL